ncbi:unnamed protein product [Acanthoscelides obtectus]|uniref:Protein YIPF n=2 Tax=Acanthoscelides obtectus TaxID=200917 RepID=A0A9P0KVA9_ACAOB|nr:unnamed protein product [Acanthoscelides obtectus]CAK1644033.1 Protein YIPF1 [Acanthoscelides obtectus]
MTNLQEVPTEELLSFQDYPTVHITGYNTTIPISDSPAKTTVPEGDINNSPDVPRLDSDSSDDKAMSKSFWSIEYYQKFFDVDTKDVVERILASVTPKWDNSLKHHLRTKPDLYGPFWISVTLIFTIAISGNVANYFQHASEKYHWRYDFHLVSYAATSIFLYVTLVPFILWALLKWSVQVTDLEGLDSEIVPGVLELICIYGYSLFIYIPVSVLWTIQIGLLQWSLVILGTFISGSVLFLTVLPALRLSKHKIMLTLGILGCHLLLAAGFMLCFFHVPNTLPVIPPTKVVETVTKAVTETAKNISHS